MEVTFEGTQDLSFRNRQDVLTKSPGNNCLDEVAGQCPYFFRMQK
jgi:hypothetical protein